MPPSFQAQMSSHTPFINTYDEALRFMDGLDVSAMKLGLDRMQNTLETLGNPQNTLPMVHIAGTNGKGSVTTMLSSILKAAGYTVGAFTSPHLVHVRERIAINGNPILPDDFQFEVNDLKTHLDHLQWPSEEWPTYFEFLTILAYRYFSRKAVDITVFETGLGGRLDSTNIVRHPHLAVITSIGLDHTAHLGETLSQIAREKAGILKAGTPLTLGPTLPTEARTVILQKAQALEIPVFDASEIRKALTAEAVTNPSEGQWIREKTSQRRCRLPLLGGYQIDNLATALSCIQQLQNQGYRISDDAITEGLTHTCWPVRFQYLTKENIVLDGSHNADGFQALAQSLRDYFQERPIYWLLSLRANRDPQQLIKLIETTGCPAGIITTQASAENLYHPAQNLQSWLQAAFPSLQIQAVPSPQEALGLLKTTLQEDSGFPSLGVITGSLYTAGEILRTLEQTGHSAIQQA